MSTEDDRAAQPGEREDDRAAQPREREEAALLHEHDQDHERVHGQEHERDSATTDARPPPDAEPGSAAAGTPLPVRRLLLRRDAAPVAVALPPAFLTMISTEELAAEAPSIETLRRVRRALRDLPDAD